MESGSVDREAVRAGFLKGQIHPDDIDSMIDLVARFSHVPFLSRALETWQQADAEMMKMDDLGRLHAVLK